MQLHFYKMNILYFTRFFYTVLYFWVISCMLNDYRRTYERTKLVIWAVPKNVLIVQLKRLCACSTYLLEKNKIKLIMDTAALFYPWYIEIRFADPDQSFELSSDRDPAFKVWSDPVWTSRFKIHLKLNFSCSIYWPKW